MIRGRSGAGLDVLCSTVAVGALAVLSLAAASCASSPGTSTPTTRPALEAEEPAGALTAILATTVLRQGQQRVAFILTRPDALVTAPQATVSSVYLDGEGAPGETRPATFYQWPYGVRGSYSTELDFSRAGSWRLDIEVEGSGGGMEKTSLLLDVKEEVGVAEVGMLPPFTRNKTTRDVQSLNELSSAGSPDPELYVYTIPEALISGMPTVVVFSTPAFCVSPTCGPQVEVLAEIKDQYRDVANFIHVELYDNPDDVQGDLSRARYSPLVESWGFLSVEDWTNESWTFVLDREGQIAARFEAFIPKEELEQFLLAEL